MITRHIPALRAGLLAAALLGAMPAAHAAFDTNLIVNGGAEAAAGGDGTFIAGSLPGWSVTGQATAISYALGCPGGYPCTTDPVPVDHGENHFGGGNVANSHATQVIDLGFAAADINGAGVRFDLSGFLGGYASQSDYAVLGVTFRDAANQVLGSSSVGPVTPADRGDATAMLYRQASDWVPTGATNALVDLGLIRTGGTSNDGYADNLSLSLLQANVGLTAPSTALLGSSFQVTVSALNPFGGAYAGDELLAFGFDFDFDATVLSLDGVATVGFDDDSAFFSDVDVAGSAFPGVLDEGQADLDLAVLTFTVIGLGDANVSVHSNYGSNLNHGLTYFDGANVDLYGRTTISAVAAPVPLPGAVWLLGSALALVGRRARVVRA